MLTDKQISTLATEFGVRFEYINTKYLELMGKHIKEIGKLTSTDVHRLKQMAKAGANIKKINQMLAAESSRTVKDLEKLFEKMLEDEYKYAKELYLYSKSVQTPLKLNKELQQHLKSIKKLTKGTFENLSKTTSISKTYRDMIDKAIAVVASGIDDYESISKDAIKASYDKAMADIANRTKLDVRIRYESGYTRRLDSAVRMNISDGIRQHYMGIRQIEGEQFGADGVEISAHALCAHDHIPIQGEQFALGAGKVVDGIVYDSFQEMNDSLVRSIGECNCKHFTMPIILGISGKAYTPEQLQEYRDYSNKPIEIDGIKRGRYDWSQVQRQLETKMRYEKDKVIFYRAAGNGEEVNKAEKRLKDLRKKYREVSEKTGLAKRYDRAYVPGYKK